MTSKPWYWDKICDFYVRGLLSRREVIAAFLEYLDASILEDEIRSLPPILFNEIAHSFRTTPLPIPKPFFIEPETPESLQEREQVWKEKARLVMVYFEKNDR